MARRFQVRGSRPEKKLKSCEPKRLRGDDKGETLCHWVVLSMNMELLLSICIGLGLSAACGFRIFVPLLVMSVAANSGHLHLAPSFGWIGSPAALVAFSAATVLEIGAYYIPWLDHFLDLLATPAAIVAGCVVTASMVSGMSPFLKWSLAIIAGGGAAGTVQAATVVARGLSFAGTGGLGNPLIATIELGGSVLASVAAVLAPLMALGLMLLLGCLFVWKLYRRRKLSRAGEAGEPGGLRAQIV
jgi:hypothetical protein